MLQDVDPRRPSRREPGQREGPREEGRADLLAPEGRRLERRRQQGHAPSTQTGGHEDRGSVGCGVSDPGALAHDPRDQRGRALAFAGLELHDGPADPTLALGDQGQELTQRVILVEGPRAGSHQELTPFAEPGLEGPELLPLEGLPFPDHEGAQTLQAARRQELGRDLERDGPRGRGAVLGLAVGVGVRPIERGPALLGPERADERNSRRSLLELYAVGEDLLRDELALEVEEAEADALGAVRAKTEQILLGAPGPQLDLLQGMNAARRAALLLPSLEQERPAKGRLACGQGEVDPDRDRARWAVELGVASLGLELRARPRHSSTG